MLVVCKPSPSLASKALPEGVQQAAREEKEEIQGHILLRAWGFNSLTVTSLKLSIADVQTYNTQHASEHFQSRVQQRFAQKSVS